MTHYIGTDNSSLDHKVHILDSDGHFYSKFVIENNLDEFNNHKSSPDQRGSLPLYTGILSLNSGEIKSPCFIYRLFSPGTREIRSYTKHPVL